MARIQADSDSVVVFLRDEGEEGAEFGDCGADGGAVAAGGF